MTDLLQNDRAWALYYRDSKNLDEIATAMNCDPRDLLAIPGPLNRVIEHALQTVSVSHRALSAQSKKIGELQHSIAEGDKLLVNLTETLDAMTGRKKAEREEAKLKALRRFKFGRNSNYLQSVKLGFTEGLLWAPTSLINTIGIPARMMTMGLLVTLATIATWIAARPFVLIAGLLGYISPPVSERQKVRS